MSNNKLVILKDDFRKDGSDELIEGLTVMVDGQIQEIFDVIKDRKGYDNYTEVLSDVIFAGLEKILRG